MAPAQPSFQQVSPVANAVAAAPNSLVIFNFSQVLTADATAPKVYSAQWRGLCTAATPAVLSGATLRFTPPVAYPFMPGERLFNTVTKQVASSSGTLPNGRVTQFTTAVSPASGGLFLPGTDAAAGTKSSFVALGDIDGDLDLVAGYYIATAGTVSVRLNQLVANLISLSTAIKLPGLPITLTGMGFGSGTTISFGGLAATGLLVNSSTSLTVVVPAGLAAGSAPVAVATNGVSGYQSSLPFTVLAVANTVTTTCPATVPYQATGDGQWHYLFTTNGQVVAALLDTRAALGQVVVQFQLIDPATTPVRRDGRGHAYLDRNFHFTTSGGLFPGTAIALRFYGLNPELDRLKLADPTVTLATLRTTQYSGANEDCDFANDDFTTGQFRTLEALASTRSGAACFAADVTVTDPSRSFF